MESLILTRNVSAGSAAERIDTIMIEIRSYSYLKDYSEETLHPELLLGGRAWNCMEDGRYSQI